MKVVVPVCLICALALVFCVHAEADNTDIASLIDSIEIIKLAGKEKRAVIRSKDSEKLKVVGVHDTIEPFGKIIDIVPERIVLKNKNSETFFIQLQNNTQKIHKISKKSYKDVYRTVAQSQISSLEDKNGVTESIHGPREDKESNH